jgi:hypothetical protein
MAMGALPIKKQNARAISAILGLLFFIWFPPYNVDKMNLILPENWCIHVLPVSRKKGKQ